MRTTAILLMTLLLSACVVERSVVELDDMYVWRRQQAPVTVHRWRGYYDTNHRVPDYVYVNPFVRPLWNQYPYWNQPSTIIVVPKQEPSTNYGKRPDRGGQRQVLPQQPNIRRGRN